MSDEPQHDPFGPWAVSLEYDEGPGQVVALTSRHKPSEGTAVVVVAWSDTDGTPPAIRFELLSPKGGVQ